MTDVLHVPDLRAVVRRAAPSFVEGKLIPLLLFIGFLRLTGTLGAVLVALGWSLGVIAYRSIRRQRVPGLVVLSAVGLGARTIAAITTGSLVVYFLQPTISTALVGLGFLVSVSVDKPLAERLAHDFVPFAPETATHPQLRRFFVRVSLLWAATSLANAAITLWLLLTQPATTFVIVKSFLGPVTTVVTIGSALVWFRRSLRRHGIRLAFGSPAPAL